MAEGRRRIGFSGNYGESCSTFGRIGKMVCRRDWLVISPLEDIGKQIYFIQCLPPYSRSAIGTSNQFAGQPDSDSYRELHQEFATMHKRNHPPCKIIDASGVETGRGNGG